MKMRWCGLRGSSGITFDNVIRVALLVLAVLTISISVRAADTWQGEEIEKDGVIHMMNPAEPLSEPVTLSPELLWSAGGDENEEYFFGVISGIATDMAGMIYLLDAQLNEVMIFSPDGDYLKSIGREGEGPGEFRRPADIFLTTDGNIAVVQRMPGKIVVLTPDGEPAGNFPAPEAPDGGLQMFAGGKLAGDQMVLATMQFQRRDDGMEEVSALIGIDGEGAKTAEYLTMTNSRNFANMQFNEKDLNFNTLVWETGMNGSVYISDDFDSYRIVIYNRNGSVDRIVEREYDLRVRSEEEREQNTPRIMIRANNRSMSPEATASKTDRAVMRIYPRRDGSFWVLSSHGAFDAPPGVIGTFDIYDSGGRFSEQVTVRGEGSLRDDGIEIIGDRLYVVKGLRSARRAMFSMGDPESSGETDTEPVKVLCYNLGGVR